MLRGRSAALRAVLQQLCRETEGPQAQLYRLPLFAAAQHAEQCSSWPLFQQRQFSSPAAFQAAVTNAHPQSLAVPKDTGDLPDDDSIGGWKHYLLRLGGFYSRESGLIRGSKALYQTVVQHSEDKELKQGFSKCVSLHAALDLPDKFASTYSLLCLHMWLVLVRLRAEGQDGRDLAQILYESFQDDVELRVHAEGVKVRISKWLKDLEKMFYGCCESYEKAVKGQEDMTDALLRNVYGDDAAMRRNAVALTHYVQRELACLKMTPSEAVMGGKINFSQFHAQKRSSSAPAQQCGSHLANGN